MITLENDKLIVKVSEHGAELKSIFGKKNNFEYMWQGDKEYWGFSSKILFPVCGRLLNEEYEYNGEKYSMLIHGFAKLGDFEVVEKSNTKVVLSLTENEKTLENYPFKFVFKVVYEIFGAKLKTSLKVFNSGNTILPFSLGGHPAFNVPLKNGGDFCDHYIEFDKNCLVKAEFSKKGLDTGKTTEFALDDKKLHLTHELFKDDALFFELKSGSATLKTSKSDAFVKIDFDDTTHVGIWQTYKNTTPFVCIEPWHGIAGSDDKVDDILDKKCIIKLQPNELYEFSYDTTVSE